MGDATTKVEEMVEWNEVDVLKVAHHGSNSSTAFSSITDTSQGTTRP